MDTLQFARYELATGLVTDMAPIPGVSVSGTTSVCIDGPGGRYILCTGTDIHAFDANDVDPPTAITLPMAATADLIGVQYDPCYNKYLGIVNDPPDSIVFASFDPVSLQFQTLAVLSSTSAFCIGCEAMFDPVSRLYMLRVGPANLLGIHADTGTIVYNTTIQTVPNSSPLNHLALDCQTDRILGTVVGPASDDPTVGKMLCELDPSTGTVTVLTSQPMDNGIMKPVFGGSTIDTSSGTFFWSAVNDEVVGANTVSGALNYLDTASLGDVFFIKHFSWCACTATNTADAPPGATPDGLRLRPDPTGTMVLIDGTRPGDVLEVVNSIGERIAVLRATAHTIEFRTTDLAPGTYIIRAGVGRSARFVVAR